MFDKLKDGVVISENPFSCVFIDKTVLIKFEKYIQNNPKKNESGGLLLGYRHSNHFEITCITTPKFFDLNERFCFERRDLAHIRIFERLKMKDNRLSYLGEWHTHPEISPLPSSQDLSQWELCRKNSIEGLLFLILGTGNFYLRLYT